MKPRSTVIYADNEFIVINKQAGMLSVPDRYDKNLTSVSRWLSKTHSDAKPLHRLDRHTSGILCFARNEEAFRHFSMAFEKRNIEKIYQAIVMGVPSPNSGLIDKPLLKLPRQNQVIVAKNGKPAQTFYSLEESYGSYAHLSLRIITGRTHQIRVHLQSIGHPLLVDVAYGGKEAFFLSEIKPKYKNRDQERPLLSRTPLHASTLTLPMMDGIPRTFEAPLPKDMRAVIRQMQIKQR